jgi:cytochrome c biogenesis protein CcmG/thiol:disulfide interchange protein DsbE
METLVTTPHPSKTLFRHQALTALFGIDRPTMIIRVVMLAAAIGTLTIITAGLLQPNSSSPVPINTSTSTHSSQVAVGLHVGNAAPNFTLSTPAGKKVSLSDYRGQPVLLNFWYATCPGCRAEIPGMQKYYASRQAAGKGFAILGINVVDDASTTIQFAQQHGLTYTIVMDENQHVEALYNINATPTSYFIDRQGIIRVFVEGPVDDTALEQNVARIS